MKDESNDAMNCERSKAGDHFAGGSRVEVAGRFAGGR